jgi:hypothetical protein
MTNTLVTYMLKKTIITLVCLLIISLTGCSDVSQTTSTNVSTTDVSTATNTTTTTKITSTTTTTKTTRPPTTTTPKPTYEFQTNELPLNPLPVTSVNAVDSFSVPLGWLALQQGDLEEGVVLDASIETNCIQVSQAINGILKSKDASDRFKQAFLNYTNSILNSGFVDKWTSISSKSGYEQDILVFFSADDAKKCSTSLAQVSLEMLESTFGQLGLIAQGEIINPSQNETDKYSWGLHLTAGTGLKKVTMYSVCNQEKNILSIITISSNTLSPVVYSGDKIDDAFLLNQKALAKIKSVLGEKNLLVQTPDNQRFPELLKLIPANAVSMNNTYWVMNDYATVRKLYDIAIPSGETSQTITEYTQAIEGMIKGEYEPTGIADFSFMSGYNIWQAGTPITLENVGYNLFGTEAEIYSGNTIYRVFSGNSTDFYSALTGHFNLSATSKAMGNQANWPDSAKATFTPQIYQNITIYSWGDGTNDKINAFKAPAFNKAGNLFPFAVTADNVFNAGSPDGLKSMIGAELGLRKSLHDIKEYELAATALSKMKIYSGFIGSDKISNNNQFRKEAGNATLLKPYLVFGTGVGKDFLGTYMALVLVHANENAANANYDILVDRISKAKWIRPVDWPDYWRSYVDYAQISIEGNVISAKLYGDKAQYFWQDWLLQKDPLLLHE